jgi:TonB-dependent receptor
MFQNRKITVTIFLFLFVSFNILAQQATLSGKIIDKKTGEELIGASIIIEGTTTGSTADLSGRYTLKTNPGTYNIVCSYISYQKVTIKNVKLEAGKVTTLDFLMETDNVALKEVVIEAEQVKNTDASIIAMQRKSYAVQDGISAQQIVRSGSSNAAESMKQITGANVDDGKYMVMRGLGDRYSIAQLNGLQMASSDPYRNAASLDLIPSNFIDNLITIKTFTPDQPGNFAGGNVNITTKNFPDKFNISFTASPSYNTQSSLIDNFYTYQGGQNDKWGFDDGTRAIPESVKDDSTRKLMNQGAYLTGNVLAQTASYYNNPLQKDRVDSTNAARTYQREIIHKSANAFNNQFIPTQTTTPLNNSYTFSIGNRVKIKEQEIGFTAGANYSRNFTFYDNGRLATLINTNQDSLFAYQDLYETKSVENPQIGAFANLAYKPHKNHSIGFIGIYSNDAEKIARVQHGTFLGQVSDSRAVFNTRSLEFTQREMKSAQVNGNHTLPKLLGIEIDWAASHTYSKQSEPDLRYLAFTTVADSVDSIDVNGDFVMRYYDTLYYMNNAEYNNPFHFFRNLNDVVSQAKIDITIPINKDKSNKIKVGAYANQMERGFEEYRFQMIPQPSRNITYYRGDFDEFLDSKNFGVIDTVYDYSLVSNDPNKPRYPNGIRQYQFGHFYINQVNNKNFYTGSQDIFAAYAMGIFSITKKLKFIGGARYETTNMSVISKNIDSLIIKVEDPETGAILEADTLYTQGKINIADILPSVNLVYDLTEKSKLRFAYAKTIARPNLRELAPFEQLDTKNGFFVMGNPLLKRTVIQNFDLRFEYYPNVGDLIAVSAYYKDFTDPIVRAFNPTATIPELKFINVDKAEVMGLELETRKNLEFIAQKLKNFTFATNFTLIKSETDIPEIEIKSSKTIDSTYNQTKRPFVGQSPYIFNAMIMYNNSKIGHESTLSFNIAGPKLYNIALYATPDVYEMPVPMLNFKTSQSIGKFVVLSFIARNLLDSEIRKTQTHRGTVYNTEAYRLGRTYGISLTVRIK